MLETNDFRYATLQKLIFSSCDDDQKIDSKKLIPK